MTYAPYYQKYIDLVHGNVFDELQQQVDDCVLYLTLSDDVASYRYAPEKWSVKELLGHLSDAERIFAYRALMIARGMEGPHAGFDEEAFVKVARFERRTVHDIATELHGIRIANLALFRSFTPDDLHRVGTANGQAVSVDALVHIVAGHASHHAAILHERYHV